MLTLFIFTLLGCLTGIAFPVILGCINHLIFKWQHRKEPNKVDTASGAVSFLLIVTVPLFSCIGFIIGLLYLFFGS
tara:strand:- start:1205 stop:1432 length:228 start_codon:yes stop_codon:yes gene_type:complete